MDWLHCNHCTVRFSKSCSFLVTNCAHIFCSKCEQKATKPVCIVCGNKCSCTPLNDQIDPAVAVFFKSPSELQKKAMECHKKAEEVRKFHDNQRKLLQKSLNKQQENLLKSSMQTIEQLKNENSQLKKIIVKNRANISISPNSSFSLVSPDRSPLTSPSRPKRNSSPNDVYSRHRNSSPIQSCNSMPCSPNKSWSDGRHHGSNKGMAKSPCINNEKRISFRSPPVDGKTYSNSPSPSSSHQPASFPCKSADGIISKAATKSSTPQPGRHHFQPYTTHQSMKTPPSYGSTPPCTPKYANVRSYSASCPVTPESRRSIPTFYSMMGGQRR